MGDRKKNKRAAALSPAPISWGMSVNINFAIAHPLIEKFANKGYEFKSKETFS